VVSDSGDPVQTVKTWVTWYVADVLSISGYGPNGSLPNANKGVSYGTALNIRGGRGPITATADGLPSGLSLNYGYLIQGTPTQAGTFQVGIHVADSSTPPQKLDVNLSLTVDSTLVVPSQSLKSGVIGRPYSDFVRVINGTAPLKFSGTINATGLTLNPDTGEISGTASAGYGGASVTVTDSSVPQQTANAYLNFTIYQLLSYYNGTLLDAHLNDQYNAWLQPNGGMGPYQYTLASGSLPPGLQLSNDYLTGLPTMAGEYQFGVNVKDSLNPPQSINQMFTLKVLPPRVYMDSNSSLPAATLGKAYSGKVRATKGTPPYTFALVDHWLPPGLTLATDGTISGTPQSVGLFFFNVGVTDSASPAQTNWSQYSITVSSDVLRRNDTIATATPISSGYNSASISPYADPVNIANPDTDYYKLIAVGGSTVTVNVNADTQLFDPVLELVDANGVRFKTCQDPGDDAPPSPAIPDSTPTAFDDECLNDDIILGQNRNSQLTFLVPGAAPQQVTFYAHVLDQRGDARPDLTYSMWTQGPLVTPLVITNTPVTASMNKAYSFQFQANGGTGSQTWALASGSTLPAGLSISASGVLAGTPTATGEYDFSVQVSDSATPPQTVAKSVHLTVASSMSFTTTTLPQCTTGVPYSAGLGVTGGKAPFYWSYTGSLPYNMTFDPSTGVFSGNPQTPVTYSGVVMVTSSEGYWMSQNVSIVVVAGPLSIPTTTLPDASVGWNYSILLKSNGGASGFSWSIVDGALPPGMTLSPSGTNVYILGTATTVGTYTFTLQLKDSSSPAQTATRTLTLNVVSGT
jgi:hypothetical protein